MCYTLQQVSNTLASLCFTALARLAGYQEGDKATPLNPAIRKSLSALLTPYLANQLGTENPNQVTVWTYIITLINSFAPKDDIIDGYIR